MWASEPVQALSAAVVHGAAVLLGGLVAASKFQAFSVAAVHGEGDLLECLVAASEFQALSAAAAGHDEGVLQECLTAARCLSLSSRLRLYCLRPSMIAIRRDSLSSLKSTSSGKCNETKFADLSFCKNT